jgi:hypothetical protein
MVGLLATILAGFLGYTFLVREEVDSKVMQVLVDVEKNKFEEQKQVNTDWQEEWEKYLPNTNFLEMKDITGDGVPEVLVNSFVAQGGSGTSVDKVLVFTIKNNKAVEIPVYKNGFVYELSLYSGNVQASRVLFTNTGVEEQQRRSKGLNPGVYEILDSKIVFTYNKTTGYLESFVSNNIR